MLQYQVFMRQSVVAFVCYAPSLVNTFICWKNTIIYWKNTFMLLDKRL